MITVLSGHLGSDPSSAPFLSLGLPEFLSVKWGVEGLSEKMDVAEASKMSDHPAPLRFTSLGLHGGDHPHSVRSLLGSVQAGLLCPQAE